jgi:hypothetical protein
MFIANLQNKIQDKLEMLKFPSFTQLCTTFRDYQNLVNSHEVKTPSNHPKKSESTPQNIYQTFKKHNKGFLQLNPP